MKLASYQGTTSTGKIKEVIGLNEDLAGRTVVIVEISLILVSQMKNMIESLGTLILRLFICTLLLKPGKVPLNYRICHNGNSNDFIVGYGLDYDQQGRQLRIYLYCFVMI